MERIRIGILGYGNLGKAVEQIVNHRQDMELAGIYSRRKLDHPMAKDVEVLYKGEDIDVLILCGGSATDLPAQTQVYAEFYHVIDSFDQHQQIEAHYKKVDEAAKRGEKVALISCGWDPGLFSLIRGLFSAVMPDAMTTTFWGRGLSQGHSDAIRRIKGVADARQYTVPLSKAIRDAELGLLEDGSGPATHRRECFVVIEEGADAVAIEENIKNMPGYFQGYDTEVHFISRETMEKEHRGMEHEGRVLASDKGSLASFQLQLSSNPQFTAGVLAAYAKAVYKLAKKGERGCRTVLEIPVCMLEEDMFMHM